MLYMQHSHFKLNYRHENGPGDASLMQRVQKMRKQDQLNIRLKRGEKIAAGLQDGSEQVPRVKGCQGHQQDVETVSHVFASQDDDGRGQVDEDANVANSCQQNSFEVVAEVDEDFVFFIAELWTSEV